MRPDARLAVRRRTEGGRIEEVALDFYAQADDGSVWYFGEDVFNYSRGVVADTAGTWLAGQGGAGGDDHAGAAGGRRRATGPRTSPGWSSRRSPSRRPARPSAGPRGPVQGAIVGGELHDDGTREDKYFAPGYGEFRSAGGGDLEAMALAVPTDAAAGSRARRARPDARRRGRGVYDAIVAHRWRRRSGRRRRRSRPRGGPIARAARRRGSSTPLHAALARARPTRWQAAGGSAKARDAALDVLDATLDLLLQFRPPAEIDRARFEALGPPGARRRGRRRPAERQRGRRNAHVDPRPDRGQRRRASSSSGSTGASRSWRPT